MKKLFLFILISLFLISLVSAWEYENQDSDGASRVYVKIVGTPPMCDGIQDGKYCTGRWYVDVSHEGKWFYIEYKASAFPKYYDESKGLFYDENMKVYGQPISDGRIYLNENGLVPKYVLCALDFDKGSIDDPPPVVNICGGWLGDYFDRYHVECSKEEHCGSGELCDKFGDWTTWNCKQDLCKDVTCSNKCENSIWYHDGECIPSTGICKYDFQDNCQYGCQNEPLLAIIVGEGMCKDNPCVGVTCEDYCTGDEKSTLATDGRCINGKCQYPKLGEKPFTKECGAEEWYRNIWIWGGLVAFIILVVFGVWYLRRMKGGKK